MAKIKKRQTENTFEGTQKNKKLHKHNVEEKAETKSQNVNKKLKRKCLSNANTKSNKINLHKHAMLVANSKQKIRTNVIKHFEQPDNEILSKEEKPIMNKVKKQKQTKIKHFQQAKTEISKQITKKKLKQQERTQFSINNNEQSIRNENNFKLNNKHNLNVARLKTMLAKKTIEEKSLKKPEEPESLRERMMMKLRASRFRYLNETLYNNNSTQSKEYFKEDPEAFVAYHNGYKQQVSQWPLNPLDVIIASIKKMPQEHIIADFGCGEALLAASVPQQVHSFDLVALNDRVKACDISHTPLLTDSVNVVVFCLSLMGTNLNDYIIEANRVLKKGGVLKIAEVESRFDQVDEFIKSLTNYGFVNIWKDLSHNLFYFLDFRKEKDITGNRSKLPIITLKPCLYKKR